MSVINPFSDEYDFNDLLFQADVIRRQLHGLKTYYVLNRHINPTNVCLLRCPLCAFSCDSADSRAYTMNLDEILEQARIASEQGCTEVHLVSAIRPGWGFAQYREMVAVIHNAFPKLHIKAFTAIEIARMAMDAAENSSMESVCKTVSTTGVTYNHDAVQYVLEQLIESGLSSMPGGGAEILDDEIRAVICPKKGPAQLWLDVHRTAHQLGLRTTATMLFGTIEKPEHRLEHVNKIRALQQETGGFVAFIPLVFHPKGTQFENLSKPNSYEKLRVIAASRLLLDNIAHIKAYWVSLGLEIAQLSLCCGADDMDGTVCKERIHHDSGATTPVGMTVQQLESLIRSAGFDPIERNSVDATIDK